MELPISADSLATQPRARLTTRKIQKKAIKDNNYMNATNITKKQDEEVLMRKMQLQPDEYLTVDRYIENNKLMREFNERWKKPKKTNQTLKEALFDVYLERKLDPDA